MSKSAGKKLHWRSKVRDSFVPLLGSSAELGIAIGGGADYGEFPFVTSAPGGGTSVGDIVLEIGGTPVLGMTLGDVRGVLNSCPHPIRIKTISPGMSPNAASPHLLLVIRKCEHWHVFPSVSTASLKHIPHNDTFSGNSPCRHLNLLFTLHTVALASSSPKQAATLRHTSKLWSMIILLSNLPLIVTSQICSQWHSATDLHSSISLDMSRRSVNIWAWGQNCSWHMTWLWQYSCPSAARGLDV